MKEIRLIGLGTAVPALRLSQEEIYQAYISEMPLSAEARHLLRHIMIENRAIGFRHLGMDKLNDTLTETQDALIARYRRFAVPIGTAAARAALNQAQLPPEAVDALVVNSCTGYLCPGLTSYLAQELGLRRDIHPFDLQGMGCGGALPNLETAAGWLQLHPEATVLSIAVEICTATLYFSEEPDVLISNAIFGDGAAAALLTARPGPGPRLHSFTAGLYPEDRDYLHYRTENSRLRNVLSVRVPALGGRHARQVIEQLLQKTGLRPEEIAHWIIHPGGEKVLDAVEQTLELPPSALALSRQVLYNYGNMSSPSLLFVLEETLRSRRPRAGDRAVLCSFGAGFSTFAALMEFG